MDFLAAVLCAVAAQVAPAYAQGVTTFAASLTIPGAVLTAGPIQGTSDGGYILAGGFAGADLLLYGWVAKLDASGNVVWQKQYSNNNTININAIRQTADGGYIVVGDDIPTPASFANTWVAKLDANGNIVWQKQMTTIENNAAASIAQTLDGGYVITGFTEGVPQGGGSGWVLKMDGNGNIQWQNTYAGGLSSVTGGSWIEPTSDGGCIVAGGYDTEIWAAKIDSGGGLTWNRAYGKEGGNVGGVSIQQTTDSGFIVSGWAGGGGGVASEYAATVLKLDSSGNLTWQKTFSQGVSGDSEAFIRQTTDGGYILLESMDRNVQRSSQCQNCLLTYGIDLLKLDSTGATSWQRRFNVRGQNAYAAQLQQTADGGYAIAGAFSPPQFRAFSASALILKTDGMGQIASCSGLENPTVSSVTGFALSTNSPTVTAAPFNPTISNAAAAASNTSAVRANLCQ